MFFYIIIYNKYNFYKLMPQLDNLTYFSQIFWFFFMFFSFYFFILNNILENLFKVFRVRNFYLNNSRVYFFEICKQNVIHIKIINNFYFMITITFFFFSKDIIEDRLNNIFRIINL